MIIIFAGSAWITLGVDLDLRKEDSAEAKQLQQAVKKFVQSLEYMTNGLPVYKIYPTRQYKQAKQSVIAMRSIGKKYLDIISKENVKRKIEKGESVSLIEQWMIEGNMSEEQCIMSACEMFGAGIDTVSATEMKLHKQNVLIVLDCQLCHIPAV